MIGRRAHLLVALEAARLYAFALVLGACTIANTPQQELAYERWAKCNVPLVQLDRIALDGQITFDFSGPSTRREVLQCLAEANRMGPKLPEAVGVGPRGGQ
jgi:hypothetical protein